MTNLKKTLAVVLAFAMMLSVGSVFAYSDVEAGTAVSEAVAVLSNLDILQGFEDGTFRPDETVTRAQMAAIICRMLGYEEQAQSSKGTTVFADVAGEHWASGYVNVTQAQGIITGYGDGNFGPEDKVTYEQAIKMIVSALGYDIAAARKGGYPSGYLAIASTEGITKRAGGKVYDAAARSTIAVLVYNALDVQLMDQRSWATDGTDTFGKQAETVLTKHHGIYKFRGTMLGTPVSYVADGVYDPDKTPMATIIDAEELIYSSSDLPRWVDDEYDYYHGDKIEDGTYTAVATKVDVNAYLGKSVLIYGGEDRVTGKETIFAITEDGTKNAAFKISATQLVEEGEKYWDEDHDGEDTIGYRVAGSNKVKDISLAANPTVYVNFDMVGSTVHTTEDLAALYEEDFGGTAEFISNDADSEYEIILVTAYDDEAVIEAVEEEDGALLYELYTGDMPDEIVPEDEDSLVIIYRDGELATAEDLTEGDTVSYVEVAENFDMYFVSSKSVEGEVESWDVENHSITVAGEDYTLSMANDFYDEPDKLAGEAGIFFLNVDGQVAHSETDPTAIGNYAVVLAAYETASGLNKGTFLQVVLADGTLAEYEISNKAKVYDADREVVLENAKDDKDTEDREDKVVYDFFTDMLTIEDPDADDEIYRADVADFYADDANLVVKLNVSNDKITKVRLFAAGPKDEDAEEKFDAEAMSIGKIDLTEKTVVFAVKQTEGFVEAEDIVIGTPASFFSDDSAIKGDVLAYDEDDKSNTYGALVGFNIAKAVRNTSDVFVVTGVKTRMIDDSEAYVLSGIQNGDKISITLYDSDNDFEGGDPEDIGKGDVLLIADANGDGIVADYAVLVDFDKEDPDTVVAEAFEALEDDDIYSGYGLVNYSGSNKFGIDGIITNDLDGEPVFGVCVPEFEDGEITGYTGDAHNYRSAAQFTLVDFAANAKNPEVSSKKGSKSLFNVEKYESYAYVRYVDGKLAEVVVFRMDEYED